MFKNRVLKIIFGPQREEVTEGWIKLRNEQIHNFCSSQKKIIKIKSRRKR
jgi:hypothetical protein